MKTVCDKTKRNQTVTKLNNQSCENKKKHQSHNVMKLIFLFTKPLTEIMAKLKEIKKIKYGKR